MQQEPSEAPFDISSVSREVRPQPLADKKAPGKKPTGPAGPTSGPVVSAIDAYEKLLSSIPEFAVFGKLFKVYVS
jgi:coatomer subunit gamma